MRDGKLVSNFSHQTSDLQMSIEPFGSGGSDTHIGVLMVFEQKYTLLVNCIKLIKQKTPERAFFVLNILI